jgi:hypothetical protein
MLKTVGFPSIRTGDQTIIDGNLVIGTSGKGIDFSATPGTGTSELLNDYEEGTWTPFDNSGAGLTFSSVSGQYTKIGRMVYALGNITFPATASLDAIYIGGLPFAIGSSQANRQGFMSYQNKSNTGDMILPEATTTSLQIRTSAGGSRTNVEYSGGIVIFCCVYGV